MSVHSLVMLYKTLTNDGNNLLTVILEYKQLKQF